MHVHSDSSVLTPKTMTFILRALEMGGNCADMVSWDTFGGRVHYLFNLYMLFMRWILYFELKKR